MDIQANEQVTPRSMRRPNSIVRELVHCYQSASSRDCKEACAGLFGHEAWDLLQNAVSDKKPSAPYDEECQNAQNRKLRQARILCARLGKVDPDAKYDSPQLRQSEFLDPIVSLARSDLRLKLAGMRYEQLLSRVFVEEVQPTASRESRYSDISLLGVTSPDVVNAMPLYLGRWWGFNLKYQPEVGRELSMFALDANKRLSIMRFGRYWGELCMHYAGTIAWDMVTGTSCILAERYADLSLPYLEEVQHFRKDGVARNSARQIEDRLYELHFGCMHEYLSVFGRDDIADLFTSQPEALFANSKQVLKIFAEPKSRKGTWESILGKKY